MKSLEFFDTTLRDGSQTVGITFSAQDKVRIAERLASFGMDWIEGGWPGANPKDDQFFSKISKRQWQHTRLVAFGSTAKTGRKANADKGLHALLDAKADAVCIFGKIWPLHVKKALAISRQENLDLIYQSILFLKQHIATVFFDAEHFFDGHRDDEDYSIKALQAAHDAGADALVLCDTNGGSTPFEVASMVSHVIRRFPRQMIGIHAHNDCDLAVANSIAAARVGARHIQGTMNGIGERCGNANLTSVIPNLMLKMNMASHLQKSQLKELRSLSNFVNEMANRMPWRHQPYVGQNAFAHKGGIHVSAVKKSPVLYEHIDPKVVGNTQQVIVSDQAGRSNIIAKTAGLSLKRKIDPHDPAIQRMVAKVKELENQGYAFEGAEASFQLRFKRALGEFRHYFTLKAFRVLDAKHDHDIQAEAEATVQLSVGERTYHTVALGNGPVNAIDKALRLALSSHYPSLNNMRMTDFKMRVLSTREGTKAMVRVLIESTDGNKKWGTVGVSTNMIEASYQALVDAIEYKLVQDGIEPPE
ncbi:MAG: citramalate synthase [Mariprofundaceae bacterium]|nr:citramalate synthase [Mariprofundaceae bacterium]